MKALLQAVDGEKNSANVSWGGLTFLTVLVLLVSLVSIGFTRDEGFIATFWPSNAVVLAILLRSSRNLPNHARILASGAIAIFLANLAGGNAPALSAAMAAANIAEVGAATALLLRLRERMDLARIRTLSIFILAAGGAAPVVGASIGAAALGHAHAAAWPPIWLNWYASDALGMVIVGPFLLTLNSASWRMLRSEKRYVEAVTILLLIAVVIIMAAYYRAFLFIIVPVMLVAIFRYRLAGAAIGMLVIAFVGSVFKSARRSCRRRRRSGYWRCRSSWPRPRSGPFRSPPCLRSAIT